MTGFLLLPDGRRVDVRDGLTLGRIAPCDVVVDDTKASRRHATLHVQGEVVEIEDLGSSNGTLLNGKPVKRRVLREGDEIQIGTTTIGYRGATAAAAPSAVDELTFDDAPAPPPKSTPPPPRPAAAAAPPPPGSPVDTLEFLDEVVQVRAQPRPTAAPGAPRGAAAPPRRERGILQFHKRDGGGLLADDLEQMGSGRRLALTVLALAVALALGYLVMRFAQ